MNRKKWSGLAAVLIVMMLFSLTPALAQSDVDAHGTCSYCGMNRGMFGQSRMLLTFEDGSQVATCSLHCAAVDLAVNIDKVPAAIEVADYGTKALIDAETAVWVIGGSLSGVMTRRAKWAFSDAAGADAFIRENGGEKADFETAIEAAYEDMYQDSRMIREKRKMMRMKKAGQ